MTNYLKMCTVILACTFFGCYSLQKESIVLECSDVIDDFSKILDENTASLENNYIPLNIEILRKVPSSCWLGMEKSKLLEIIPFENIEIRHFNDSYSMLVFPAEKFYYSNVYTVNSLTFVIRDKKVDDIYFVYRN